MYGNTDKNGNGTPYWLLVDTEGRLSLVGAGAEDAAVAGNPLLIAGRYDITPRTLDDGDVGAVALDAAGRQDVVGAAAEDAPAAGSPLLMGGRHDVTPRTLDDGDAGAMAIDTAGRQIVVGAAAENAPVVGAPLLIAGRHDAVARTLDDGDVGALALDIAGLLLLNSTAEVEALASAARTGDATADLENHSYRGAALLLNVTAVGGTPGQIDALNIQAKIGSTYLTIYSFSTLAINATGQYAFLLHPDGVDAGSWTATPVKGIIPRNWRISVDHANETDSITYSLTVSYMR